MDTATPRRAPWSMLLIGAATLCLVAAGGLMWWRHGAAIFTEIVSAAVAWCF